MAVSEQYLSIILLPDSQCYKNPNVDRKRASGIGVYDSFILKDHVKRT